MFKSDEVRKNTIGVGAPRQYMYLVIGMTYDITPTSENTLKLCYRTNGLSTETILNDVIEDVLMAISNNCQRATHIINVEYDDEKISDAEIKALYHLAKNTVGFKYSGEVPTLDDVLNFAKTVFHKRPTWAMDNFIAHLDQQNNVEMNNVNISHLLMKLDSILRSAYPDLDYMVDMSTFDLDKFRTEPWWNEE